jgi:hypothetical protein
MDSLYSYSGSLMFIHIVASHYVGTEVHYLTRFYLQCPLWNGIKPVPLLKAVWRTEKLINVKCLSWCLAYYKSSYHHDHHHHQCQETDVCKVLLWVSGGGNHIPWPDSRSEMRINVKHQHLNLTSKGDVYRDLVSKGHCISFFMAMTKYLTKIT